MCCVIFSFKTGRLCLMISPPFLPIHAPLDKSGSLLILTKSSFRASSGWENNWARENTLRMIHLFQSQFIQQRCSCSVQSKSHALLWSYLQAVSLSAGKESPLWAAIENLQRGVSWHRTKPFLIFEARYFQATTLGFPLEISKYYETVNGITVNGEEWNPTAFDQLWNQNSID